MNNFAFILERLSSRAKNALIAAQLLSEELHHPHIGTEHLLYGIISEKSSFAAEILSKANLSQELIRTETTKVNAHHTVHAWRPVLSEDLKNAIERAAIIASQYGYQFIGTEHFLYGLVTAGQNAGKQILEDANIDLADLEHNLVGVFENISKFPEIGPDQAPGNPNAAAMSMGQGTDANRRGSALEYFTTDLTQKAHEGRIDPVIGRTAEIERMISILNRRTKNNPVLIGEAGVGKTAIVEGLALAITRREVPDSLLDKKILALDLALVVAGSMFRGEFENRLKQIIEEAKANPNIILFIDELHTMVGAGATSGSLDAANILKPALARGELRTIGATTLAEYKKHIEHDAALERRFQAILVKEPTVEETVDILKGLRPAYEQHHKIGISDEAITAAVELSTRYIQDHHLPDKAVDILDETAAFLQSLYGSSKLAKAKKKLEHELSTLETEKNKAVSNQDFTTAIHLRTQEEKLKKQQTEIETALASENTTPSRTVTAEDIAHTVSLITKIPITKLANSESRRLTQLEKLLKTRVVGQDETISEIARSIRRSRAGITDPQRPLGSFLFLGPTGVGKTETAKALAEEVYGDADALVRVDMSEFMERHNVSRLVGAPAGYVGYEEGGKLTEAIRRKPYAVVLFDELEKAHPEVFNIFLQILEDGVLTDAQGRVVSFRNTIIIMTSNLGMQELTNEAERIGFSDRDSVTDITKAKLEQDYTRTKTHVLQRLQHEFRPEFLNRIDKILVFKPLGPTELQAITELHIERLAKRLAKQQISLTVTETVATYLAKQSYNPRQGARLVRRNVQELLEDPIAEHIIRHKLLPGHHITAHLLKDKISFTIEALVQTVAA
jgi:ATP-dependent Clp protease ATP-binding subunit ClpC